MDRQDRRIQCLPEPSLSLPQTPPAAERVVKLIPSSGGRQLHREALELRETPPHPKRNRPQPHLGVRCTQHGATTFHQDTGFQNFSPRQHFKQKEKSFNFAHMELAKTCMYSHKHAYPPFLAATRKEGIILGSNTERRNRASGNRRAPYEGGASYSYV